MKNILDDQRKKDLSDAARILSASSMTEECDAFNDALDNEDCKGIILNCLKKL